jgi:hypothetical protein
MSSAAIRSWTFGPSMPEGGGDRFRSRFSHQAARADHLAARCAPLPRGCFADGHRRSSSGARIARTLGRVEAVSRILEVPGDWIFLGYFCLGLPSERDGYTRARVRGLGTAAALGGIRAASMRLRTSAPHSASLGGAAPGPGDCRPSYRRATRSCRSRARDECRRRASSAPGR